MPQSLPLDRRAIVLAALPVVIAVGVFGVSLGVLAVAANIPGWHVVLMSATVFAGSAQFAAVSIIATGGGTASAVLAGALLNSRYAAIGAACATQLPGGRLRRFLLAQLVVDESYTVGLVAGVDGRPDRQALLLSGAMLWTAWVMGTALGVLLGDVVGDPATLGLDAAFPALFVALLWPLLRRPGAVRSALIGAAVALALAPFTPAGVRLAGAALAGLVVAR